MQAQRNVKAETGGIIEDLLDAYISSRVNVLQADIITARKARQLTQAQADTLWQHSTWVRRFVKQQGFLSATESTSALRGSVWQSGWRLALYALTLFANCDIPGTPCS